MLSRRTLFRLVAVRLLVALALVGLSLVGSAFLLPPAEAQDYPSRPITIMVPFAAGGPTDFIARTVARKMEEVLGQPVVVENATGAGGTISITRTVNSAPDGYTLSVGNWSSHVGAGALYPVPWHVVDDLQPVIRLPTSTLMIVARTGLPASNVEELIKHAKSNPGRITAAIVGFGSGAHVCFLDFMEKTGTQFQFVPYRGGAPVMTDLIGNHVDIFCAETSQTLSAVRAGQIRPVVVMSTERWPLLPEVPTAQQLGIEANIEFMHGMWAPKGTPPEIVEKLNAAARAAFRDEETRKKFEDLGLRIPPEAEQTPAALGGHHRREVERWWPVIKRSGAKPE